MSRLETQLTPRSADFCANADAMRALVADLQARGKLLLDPGTPLLELAALHRARHAIALCRLVGQDSSRPALLLPATMAVLAR